MKEVLWYVGRPALASHRSVGPPRWTSGTVAGDAGCVRSLPHLESSARDVPSGFSTTNGMPRSIRARHFSAIPSCGPKT